MNEFDDFADDLHAKHTARQNDHDAKQREAKDRARTAFDAGTAFLNGHVWPILNEASQAFERKGFRVELKRNWTDGQHAHIPGLSLQVFGQKKRAHEDSSYEIGGDIASACHDGEKVSAAFSPTSHNPFPGKTILGYDLEAVRKAAKRALLSLYEVLDPARS